MARKCLECIRVRQHSDMYGPLWRAFLVLEHSFEYGDNFELRACGEGRAMEQAVGEVCVEALVELLLRNPLRVHLAPGAFNGGWDGARAIIMAGLEAYEARARELDQPVAGLDLLQAAQPFPWQGPGLGRGRPGLLAGSSGGDELLQRIMDGHAGSEVGPAALMLVQQAASLRLRLNSCPLAGGCVVRCLCAFWGDVLLCQYI